MPRELARARPVFYDCEASSIGGTPIEIGWAYFDETSRSIVSEGHLVKGPWDVRPSWDPDAEKLHGISRERLRLEGKPPFRIVRRMNEVLAGRELYSDAPADDERWLGIILEEAGIEPAFTIRRVHADVLVGDLAVSAGWDVAGYERVLAEATALAPRLHRAEPDARHLAMLWSILGKGPPVAE